MTGEQADWLRKNKSYSAIGQGRRYGNMGMLHADGTFEPHQRGRRPNVRQGSFEVGIPEVPKTPGMQTGMVR